MDTQVPKYDPGQKYSEDQITQGVPKLHKIMGNMVEYILKLERQIRTLEVEVKNAKPKSEIIIP